MTNLMPQPWKHPKLGTYYYRKIVPPHLRAGVGRLHNRPSLTELRIPLGTSDARLAKLKYPEAAAQADTILARAAGGAVHLTQQQIVALGGVWYGRELAAREADPGDLETIEETLWHLGDIYDNGDGFRLGGRVREAVAGEVNHFLAAEKLQVDDETRAAIEERIFFLMIELYRTLKRRAAGDYAPDPKLQTFPEWRGPETQPKKPSAKGAVLVSDLFETWAKERRFPAKTKDLWEGILGKLTAHVGHEDASRVTDVDIIAWKDGLVSSSLAPKTIANNLTVAKTFFRWAFRNKKVASDPAANVDYKAKKRPGDRKQSYSDDDARLILLKAREEKDAVKRWAPWLCAFSGARIDEICGAMVSDVRREGRIHYVRIDPANREEGASVKNQASIRNVPLHPAIIKEGFLKYIAKLPKNGALFPNIKPDRYGKRGGNGQRTVARWIRNNVGITNKRISPNHSWRHRFADECRKVGVPKELRFAIDGHADATEGGKYGSEGFPLSVLAVAVKKIKSPV